MKKYFYILTILFICLFSSCSDNKIIVSDQINLTYGETLNVILNFSELNDKTIDKISYEYDSSYFDSNLNAIKLGETKVTTIYKNKRYETSVTINDTIVNIDINESIYLNDYLVINPTNLGSRTKEEVLNNIKTYYDESFFTQDFKAIKSGETRVDIIYGDDLYIKTIHIADNCASDRDFLDDFEFVTFTGKNYIVLTGYDGNDEVVSLPKTLFGLETRYHEKLLQEVNVSNYNEFQIDDLTFDKSIPLNTKVSDNKSTQEYSEGFKIVKDAHNEFLTIETPGFIASTDFQDFCWNENGEVKTSENIKDLYATSDYLGYLVNRFESTNMYDNFSHNKEIPMNIHVAEGIRDVVIFYSVATFDLPSSLRNFYGTFWRQFAYTPYYDVLFHNTTFDYLCFKYDELEVLDETKETITKVGEGKTAVYYYGSESNPYLILLLCNNNFSYNETIKVHDDCIAVAEFMPKVEKVDEDGLGIWLGKSLQYLVCDFVYIVPESISKEKLDNMKSLVVSRREDLLDKYVLSENGCSYIGTKENPYYMLFYQKYPNYTVNENAKIIMLHERSNFSSDDPKVKISFTGADKIIIDMANENLVAEVVECFQDKCEIISYCKVLTDPLLLHTGHMIFFDYKIE